MEPIPLVDAIRAVDGMLDYFESPDFPNAEMPPTFQVVVTEIDGAELGHMYVTQIEWRTDKVLPAWYQLASAFAAGCVAIDGRTNEVDMVVKQMQAREAPTNLVSMQAGRVETVAPKKTGEPFLSIGIVVRTFMPSTDSPVGIGSIN